VPATFLFAVACAVASGYDSAPVIWLWILVIVGLKIPTSAMVYLGWRFSRESDAAAAHEDDGGARTPPHEIHPRKPSPTGPRRGPHGDPAPLAPPRVRTAGSRSRVLGH